MPNFLRNWKLLSGKVNIYILISRKLEVQFFFILPRTLYYLLNNSYLSGYEHVILIYIYLIFNYAEHHFRSLLSQCIYSLKKYLFKSLASFSTIFLLLNCNYSLYIWNSSPLSSILVFYTSLWDFYFLDAIICNTGFFFLMNVSLTIFKILSLVYLI